MDLTKRRAELMAEFEQQQQAAATFAERASIARDRCTFLRGAIAVINDQIGPVAESPPAPAGDPPPPAPVVPRNRAERRRAAKGANGNGASAAPGS